MKKERLDKILVDLGYFENKSKASAAILAGNVKIGTEVITKAGHQLDPTKEYDFQIKNPAVRNGGIFLFISEFHCQLLVASGVLPNFSAISSSFCSLLIRR